MTDNTLPPRPTDLELKRPAEVRPRHIRVHRAAPQLPARRVETLMGTAGALSKELARLKSTGELLDTGRRRIIPAGEHAGLIELRVAVRPRPGMPVWAKGCVIGGTITLSGAAIIGSIAWFLSAMTAPAVIAVCAVAVTVLALLIKASGRGGGRARGVSVVVTTTTSVHVR